MAEMRRQPSSFATLGCHAFSGRFLHNDCSLSSQDANERIAILLINGPRTGIDFQTIRWFPLLEEIWLDDFAFSGE